MTEVEVRFWHSLEKYAYTNAAYSVINLENRGSFLVATFKRFGEADASTRLVTIFDDQFRASVASGSLLESVQKNVNEALGIRPAAPV